MPAFDKEQMDAIVTRFLGWKLPLTFSPDAGISFTPTGYMMSRDESFAKGWWPIGTNLLTADEARAMLEHVLDVTFIPDWSMLQATQASLREHMALARGLRDALQKIADMDPAGQRADDLGMASRVARTALKALGPSPTIPEADQAEAEADADIAAGRVKNFNSASEAVEHLRTLAGGDAS
jgi:hypothetical protein